ncbi:serine/threonine-protein kinase [Nodosilinea sp. E11]|uniref:serine/threonine protein kinase n=1 Tax=Nodosilinea sp. E11 TaxID=3037479 RepID=UPI00293508ED|nr:serine/threonine-protein kinase [Nodosilinea sp. E11]WOD36994.1 serine/threonine-protein kinase [Nodosilinea sp. E11]
MAEFDGSTDSPFVNQILQDRYQIQALLGRKPGRQTFLALDLQNQLPVVIKLLLFSPDFTWEDLKLFEREAEILKALAHPAIPQYLDFFEVKIEFGKGFALVQSYIEARSLQQWIQDGCRFSEAELMAIVKALIDILEYLHRLQPPVIHRDIKPSNVLLKNRSGNSPGEIYLIDFGSAQTAAHGGTVTVVGTYGYMPPEQFGGRSLPASDLYGVGMTLIYLATGQHPADLTQNDLHVEFKHLTTLSGPFISWIEWLTDPSITKRPATAQDARLHFLKPRQEPKAALIRQTKHLGITTHPSSSISLEITQTTLQLKVPLTQIRYFFPGMNDIMQFWAYLPLVLLMFPAYLELVSLPFFETPISKFCLALPFLVVGFLISFSKILPTFQVPRLAKALGNRFENARGLPNTSANVTFQKKDREVVVTLNLLKGVEKTVICQGRLIGISNDEPIQTNNNFYFRYQLGLYFPDNDQMITIEGVHREIEWLSSELSKWTGIQKMPWRQPF